MNACNSLKSEIHVQFPAGMITAEEKLVSRRRVSLIARIDTAAIAVDCESVNQNVVAGKLNSSVREASGIA